MCYLSGSYSSPIPPFKYLLICHDFGLKYIYLELGSFLSDVSFYVRCFSMIIMHFSRMDTMTSGILWEDLHGDQENPLFFRITLDYFSLLKSKKYGNSNTES